MKEAIHPNYPPSAVKCACGNNFVTKSTKGDMQVDVCAACHPFYTGTQKLMDTAGRVDRFRKRYEKSDKAIANAKNPDAPIVAPAPAPAPAPADDAAKA